MLVRLQMAVNLRLGKHNVDDVKEGCLIGGGAGRKEEGNNGASANISSHAQLN